MNAPPQPELVYHLPSSGSGQAVDADYFGRVLQDASLTGGAVTLRNGDALVARMQAINAVAPAMIERDARDLLSLVMDQLGMFLFPCPLYSSPLRMVLDPRSTVLVSSFETLRLLCIAERKVFHGCGLPDAQKRKIEDTRNRFLSRLATFARVEGGFHRLFLLPPNEPLTDAAFIKENFFNSLNVINIMELSILDYLGFPESEQQVWATYGQSTLPASTALRQECWAKLAQEMGATADVTSATWIKVPVLRDMMSRARAALIRSCCLPCSGCNVVESKAGQFKRCSRCSWARYHNAECQKKAWPAHKLECAKPRSLEEMDKGRLLIGASVEPAPSAAAVAAPASAREVASVCKN